MLHFKYLCKLFFKGLLSSAFIHNLKSYYGGHNISVHYSLYVPLF